VLEAEFRAHGKAAVEGEALCRGHGGSCGGLASQCHVEPKLLKLDLACELEALPLGGR
jgi:hypothetical protein